MSEFRKEIVEFIETLSLYDFEGDIEEIITFLKGRSQVAIEKDYYKAEIRIERECDEVYIRLVGTRSENDVEFNRRLERNRKAALKRAENAARKAEKEAEEKEARRLLFEKLKAEFE